MLNQALTYRLCGHAIESDILLPCIPSMDGIQGKWRFRLHHSRQQLDTIETWQRHQFLPNGESWLLTARTKYGFLFRFPNLADFTASNDCLEIDCYPCPNTAQETIHHLLLDQVIPALLDHEGEFALHAGGVASEHGAIVFLGESGRGKSTLCSSFNQAGFPLLSDDFLLLREERNGFVIIPSYPGLRLWPNGRAALKWDAAETTSVAHYTTKERLDSPGQGLPFLTDSIPVTTLFVLTPPGENAETDAVVIQPLASREAFLAMLNSTFRLEISDKHRNQESFRQIGNAVAKLNVCSLAFPRKMSQLPEVRAEILAHLGSEQQAS